MKRSEKVILGLAVVGLGVTAGYVALLMQSQQRRDAALARTREAVSNPATLGKQRLSSDAEPTSAPGRSTHESEIAGGDPWAIVFIDGDSTVDSSSWQAFMKGWTDWPEKLTDEIWAQGGVLVDHWAGLLNEADVALASGDPAPVSQPKLPWNPSRKSLVLDRVAELFTVRAEFAFRRGDTEGGVHDIVSALRTADQLDPNADFYGLHARQHIHEHVFRCMGRSMTAALPRDQADALLAQLAASNQRYDIGQVYMDYALRVAEIAPEDRHWFGLSGDSILDRVLQNPPSDVMYASALGAPLVNADVTTYLDLSARTAAVLEQPYYEGLPEMGPIEKVVTEIPRRKLICLTFLPWVRGEALGIASDRAWLDLSQIGIVIEQYRQETGRYPATLDEIAPEMPEGVPEDPYTGKPYVYTAAENTFYLCSVGADGKDNGGRYKRNTYGSDIIWRGEQTEIRGQD